mmetsp:Transcript_41286/g.130914  ORF Transcript_41286/g.130914 Transcript_41286/m.130914 type:complete len:255 (-) Transcript_41286:248-1012(-)
MLRRNIKATSSVFCSELGGPWEIGTSLLISGHNAAAALATATSTAPLSPGSQARKCCTAARTESSSVAKHSTCTAFMGSGPVPHAPPTSPNAVASATASLCRALELACFVPPRRLRLALRRHCGGSSGSDAHCAPSWGAQTGAGQRNGAKRKGRREASMPVPELQDADPEPSDLVFGSDEPDVSRSSTVETSLSLDSRASPLPSGAPAPCAELGSKLARGRQGPFASAALRFGSCHPSCASAHSTHNIPQSSTK